jgi:hypothetical protein
MITPSSSSQPFQTERIHSASAIPARFSLQLLQRLAILFRQIDFIEQLRPLLKRIQKGLSSTPPPDGLVIAGG